MLLYMPKECCCKEYQFFKINFYNHELSRKVEKLQKFAKVIRDLISGVLRKAFGDREILKPQWL